MLAGMPVPLRLQIRRLLRHVPAIEVVGQVFEPGQWRQTLASTGGNWLLLDAGSGLPVALELEQYVERLSGCIVLLPPGCAPPAPPIPRVSWLPRPETLDAEHEQGDFCQALIHGLLPGKTPTRPPETPPPPTRQPMISRTDQPVRRSGFDVLAIGSSTGGPEALHVLLAALAGRLTLPVVITQHIGRGFTASLAQSLANCSKQPCAEARDGELLLPGRIYLAPGGHHLSFRRHPQGVICQLDDGPPECFCKPSVDVMLRSLSGIPSLRTLAVILTGMGQDGLNGSACIKAKGGTVLAQDEATSVVWGMPGAVAKAALCDAIVPLHGMGETISRLLERNA